MQLLMGRPLHEPEMRPDGWRETFFPLDIG